MGRFDVDTHRLRDMLVLGAALTALMCAQAQAQTAASAVATPLSPVIVEGGRAAVGPRQARSEDRRGGPRTARASRRTRAAAAPVVRDRQPAIQAQAPVAPGAGGEAGGFVRGQTSTGTKTATAIVDTPQMISVVTKEQIAAQAATTVSQALRYEPGVVAEARPGNRSDSVFIRGFGGFGGNANYVQFLDNLRLPKGVSYAIPSIDPYSLERIDVLQGPASVLYGQSNPGGLINLVGKRPLAYDYHEVMTRVGSDGYVEGGFDLSGPVDKDGKLLYRLIGLGRDADNVVKYSKDQRMMLAPMFTYMPDADTKFSIQASFQRDPASYQSNWMPAVGTLLPNANGQIPYKFFSGNPNYNKFTRDQASLSYQFEHSFSDLLTFQQNFRYMHLDTNFEALSVPATGSAYAAASACGGKANLCLARSTTHYVEHLDAVTLDNHLESRFSTGPVNHDVLLGLDYQWTGPKALYGNGATSYVNYLAPAYSLVAAPTLTTRQVQDNRQIGLYGEDQIQWENWHLQLGVRHDWSDVLSKTTTLASNALTRAETDSDKTTYRAGLLYKFDNGIAPFVDYATSFEPQNGTSFGGKAFVPTTGEQYEGGIKYAPPGIDALLTLAVYDLRQFNVLTTDTVHTSTSTTVTGCSSSTCQIQTGEVHSDGIDVSAKASPLPGLSLIASYGLAHVEVARSTVVTSGIAVQGKRPVGVPETTAGLWGDYTVQTGYLRGFGGGGGVRYIGSSYGDAINTIKVPDYVLLDAQVHYDFGQLRPELKGLSAAVNASNLLDKQYVAGCASANQCFYGTGRKVLATISYRW